MRLALLPASRVLIGLRATGLLRAVVHDPTLTACLEPAEIELDEVASAARLELRARVDAIEAPPGMTASDRDRMLANLRGPEVLESARFPLVELHGRFEGTLEGGRVTGDLVVRGTRRPVDLDVTVTRDRADLHVGGAWSGSLSQLGVRPFRALLGAVRLDDWLRLTLALRLGPT
jgi:polyisoprenoid-binding protein YceI